MQNQVFDQEALLYDQWFSENHLLYLSEFKAIENLLPKAGRGLEIGVGTGIFAHPLGIKEGLEPSSKMAELARSRGIEVTLGKAEMLPYADASYDFALMVTVDCFLDDIKAAFAEVKRVLKRGSSFLIAFLDLASPLGQVYQENKSKSPFYREANFHSSAEILGFLEEAGFQVKAKRQTIFSLDNQFQLAQEGHGKGVFALALVEKV